MKFDDIRSKFVEYYEELGFQLLPRAPMLHPSIPMSFVMSAGLAQIEASLSKVQNRSGDKFVLVQDCFRHFDLEKVGTDDIHLSLFEMPGAFVFSKNGKTDAINNMWNLATKKLRIDTDRIWASYFIGGQLKQLKLPEDKLTRQTWLDIGFPEKQLIGLGIDDNYWVQGNGLDSKKETLRKCGASTELFYDRGSKLACGETCKPGCKCGRFVEFSNSLFISHEFHTDENILTPMKDPFIETVIGSERVSMILQGAESVFDTDFYHPILNIIRKFSAPRNLPKDLIRISEKVIADYLRALCVLVGDGAPPPGKNGRERIIKLLIRGMLTRTIILSITSKIFLPVIIDVILPTIEIESVEKPHQVREKLMSYFETESLRFQNTIQRGYRQLELVLNQSKNGKNLSGQQILSLEKKWGVPHLLTAFILREKGLDFKSKDYQQALEKWKYPAND
jgi:alanyl-tRNA synthetase